MYDSDKVLKINTQGNCHCIDFQIVAIFMKPTVNTSLVTLSLVLDVYKDGQKA